MSEVRTILSAALLAAGVSAVVSAGFMRYAQEPAPGIASVRLADLAAAHVFQAMDATRSTAGTAGTGALEETAAAYDARKTRAWAGALERALEEVAARRGAVLLPARAVAAGAVDVTEEVRSGLAGLLAMEEMNEMKKQETRP